jgi:cytochrome c oxidase subunit 2
MGVLENTLPHDASMSGSAIDEVVVLSVTILSVIALLGLVCLAVLIVRGRRKEPISSAGSRPWVLPIGLAALFLFGFDGYLFVRSIPTPALEATGDPIRIEVNAHQWAWEFRYAGRDQTFATPDDVVTTNEVRIPLGRPVTLELGSSDVVHAFHLPNFRIKRDVIPGHLTRVGFVAKERGRFDIACAQFCGVQHYRMQGVLRVGSAAEVDAWLDLESQDSLRMAKEKQRAEAEGEVRKPEQPPLLGRQWGWPWR